MLHTVSAKEYMAGNLLTFKPQQDVLEAIALLIEHGISGAPVIDAVGDIIGMLSEKDCLKVALEAGYDQSWGGKVEDFMSRDVITVDADDSVLDVAKMFIDSPYKRYPVVEDNNLIGQISRRDVLRAIQVISQS